MDCGMHVSRLLLPLKGEEVDEEVMRLAADLVRPSQGHIYALYVIRAPRSHPVDADFPEEVAQGEAVLGRVEKRLAELKCTVTAEFLQAREVGPAVIQEAQEREVDIVLLGMPYRRRHGFFSLGRTVPYILEHAPCPVLLLREPMTVARPLWPLEAEPVQVAQKEAA